MDTTVSLESQTVSEAAESRPGVVENPNGGHHIHVRLNERGTAAGGLLGPRASMPPGTPVLAEMLVFEDCVLLALQNGAAIVLHVSAPEAAGSVVYFYHAAGTLWRAAPLEQLNPGWVYSTYCFRGDLRKFETRLERVRSRPARPSWKTSPTFWATGGWQGGIVYVPLALVWRVRDWEHSPLPEPRLALPNEEQVKRLGQAYPADVQQILALREQDVEKVTYQIGGLHLVLNYVERIGLVEAVNRYCPRQGDISDGTVIAVLVVNRLLASRALRRIDEWVADTGLHFLLGIADPDELNYDRLADALLAVYPHWQNIAAEVTLRAVEQFQLKVETIHYDLTSVFFHGEYEGSDWVTFGYSRDKRPDKRQVNIGISATADGEVVLPGGSGIHPGSTNDGTTMVPAHERLHRLFQRSDLLVTGDSIMHSAKNMLTVARAHGRFLGATKLTPYVRQMAAGCPEDTFQTLSASTEAAGHEIKATLRRLRFTVKEKLSPAERKRVAQRRRRRGIRGRTPSYREVHFWVRAAIILDTARQKVDAKRRARRIVAYEKELKWTLDHLNQGRYYGDPEWVSGHLADLSHQFKDVRAFVKVTFIEREGVMSLMYHRRPDRIAKAARLDGRWVLVTNQRPETGQAVADYLDWMVCVYKNHRHVERRMRNLKSDLPIRPIYLHRDDAIVALCFVSVVALMVYTLIERDCQANPVLVEAGLRTTDQVLAVLHSFCLTVYLTPSGYEVFWLDTPTGRQTLIWQQLQIPDPGTRVPTVRPAFQEADSTENPASFFSLKSLNKGVLWLVAHSPMASVLQICLCWMYSTSLCWVGKVLLRSYLFCYAENETNRVFKSLLL
jgi:transposase